MPIRNATRRICATCRYWSGERKFFIDGKGISKYNLKENAVGICQSEGNFKNCERLELKTCICYAQKEER